MSPRTIAAAACGVALLAIPGCSKASDADGPSVAVDSGNDTCDVATTEFTPGAVTFKVTNSGDDITEVYVYGKKGDAFTKIVDEVENIGPGTSREMTVDLEEGEYQVTCKPGMVGDGIPTTITVSAAK